PKNQTLIITTPFSNMESKLNPFIEDVFYEFFSFITLDTKFILNCRLVCKQWNNMILKSSNLWSNVQVCVRDLKKLPQQFKPLLARIKCNHKITDNDLKHVSDFIKLQHLNLRGCTEITDKGLQHLITLTSLQTLYCVCTVITDN